jgi:hypothetical protein
MATLSRLIVLVSALAATVVVAYADAPAVPSLPWLCLGIALGAAVVARASLPAALFVLLAAVYLAPVGFLVLLGHHHYAYSVMWMSALLGIIGGQTLASPWSLPPGWRWPLVTWALLLAIGWPAYGWRELDFTWPLVWDERLPVADLRVSGPRSVAWTAYVASVQMVGLVWVDWLFARFAGDRRAFFRQVSSPLAISMAIACAVGVYQGFVDISALSGHAWPSLRRATGTLLDANVFGTLAAMWAPTALAVGVAAGRHQTIIAAAGLTLACAGVWTSGSRTALLAAGVGVVIALAQSRSYLQAGTARRRWGMAIACAMVLLSVVLALTPSASTTAVQRAKQLLPSLSADSVLRTADALWDRDGYGRAARAMLSEHPLWGVGPGAFHTLVYGYGMHVAGVFIPPDNAQNWFRHQLTEFGWLGSIPWIGWVIVMGIALRPRAGTKPGPGALARGPLLGFAAASLLGVPGQDPAIVITFWVLVFWYAADAGQRPADRRMPKVVGIAALFLVLGYAASPFLYADLRPPFRAARFNFNYTYGFYFDPEVSWSAGHGVTVPRAAKRWMKLTCWVSHPDANENPVRAEVWRDGEQIIDRRLRRGERVLRYVRVPGANKRFVLEVEVGRTWRPSDHGEADFRELGLAMVWEFVDRPPP